MNEKGKSAGVKEIARAINKELIDIRLSQYEPTDFSGIPVRLNDRQATHLPFDMIPLAGDDLPEGKDGWVLFLDEINHAKPATAAAVYKLILDRQIGKYDIHPDIDIIAAGNLVSDRALVQVQSSATNSRLVHLYMEPNTKEWLESVGTFGDIDIRVLAFLGEFPEKLMDFDPKNMKNVDSFCSPRAWERVSDMLKSISVIEGLPEDMPDDVKATSVDLAKYLPALAGSISPGVAMEFVTFCKVFKDIIPADTIIKDPKRAPLPSSVSATWATIMALFSRLEPSNKDEAKQVFKYVDRLEQKTFSVLFAQMAFNKSTQFSTMPELIKMLRNNHSYIQDDSYSA